MHPFFFLFYSFHLRKKGKKKYSKVMDHNEALSKPRNVTHTLYKLYGWIKKGLIDLEPDFQRGNLIWFLFYSSLSLKKKNWIRFRLELLNDNNDIIVPCIYVRCSIHFFFFLLIWFFFCIFFPPILFFKTNKKQKMSSGEVFCRSPLFTVCLSPDIASLYLLYYTLYAHVFPRCLRYICVLLYIYSFIKILCVYLFNIIHLNNSKYIYIHFFSDNDDTNYIIQLPFFF